MNRAARTSLAAACTVAALALLATGCGPDEARQVPSAPVGTIAGKVTSLKDGNALAGVKVSVLKVDAEGVAAEASATTGADGTYAIGDLPAGSSYRVRFAQDGFVPRFLDVEIPNSAGEFPQGNGVGEGNIALAPATAGITGKIIAGGAKAAVGAKVGIDLRSQNFDLVAEAIADATGTYSFAGLPGAPTGVPVTIVVQPYDENGDGQADYGVVQESTLAFPGIVTRTEIDLRTAASGLELLASDVDDGEHPTSEGLHFTFNRPVNGDRLDVSLKNISAGTTLGVGGAVDASGVQVTVTPSGGKLAEGDYYEVTLQARAANGSSGTFTRVFQAISGSGATLPSVTNFKVSPDEIDWTSTNFILSWDPVNNATAYRIYAKDTRHNPTYVLLKTVGSSPNPQTTLTLPSSFDVYEGDSYVTPFAFNVSVDFAVVAVNSLGDSAAPGPGSVRKEDGTAPQLSGVIQSGNADNTQGTEPAEVTLSLSTNEYLDPAVAPQIELPSSLLGTWEADADLLGGSFTIIVPPGLNATGAYKITGLVDSSGNLAPELDGTLSSKIQLVTNGDFESCSLTGWNTLISGSSSAPATVNGIAASGTCSVRVGNTSSSGFSQSGVSGVYQTVTLPASSTITFTVSYSYFSNINLSGHDWLYCDLQTTTGSTLVNLVNVWSSNSSFQTATASLSGYGGGTYRIFCGVTQDGVHSSGAYIDDISIVAQP